MLSGNILSCKIKLVLFFSLQVEQSLWIIVELNNAITKSICKPEMSENNSDETYLMFKDHSFVRYVFKNNYDENLFFSNYVKFLNECFICFQSNNPLSCSK